MSHYSKPMKRVPVPHVCSVKLFHAALVLLGWKFLTGTKPHFDTTHGLRDVRPVGGDVSYSGTGSGRVCCSRLSMDSVRSWCGISWLASSAMLQNPSAWHTSRKRKWTQQLQMLGTGRWGGEGGSKADLYNTILENWTATQLAQFIKWNVWTLFQQAFHVILGHLEQRENPACCKRFRLSLLSLDTWYNRNLRESPLRCATFKTNSNESWTHTLIH